MLSATAFLTMEEFLELPDLPAGRRELLRGELIELPPAKFERVDIADRLLDGLKAAAAVAGIGGRVFHEMGYRLSSRHWLQPDVSIAYPDQPREDYLQGSPLLGVEIVPSSNTAEKIDIKIEDYLTFGAREVWVVYPDRRHLWVSPVFRARSTARPSSPPS